MTTFSIIDANEFFFTITIEYQRFSATANALIVDLPELDPASILDRCTRLGQERQRLAELDDQLIEIMNLAGEDLAHSAHIANYRQAFASATMAIDTIHHRLLDLKKHHLDNQFH